MTRVQGPALFLLLLALLGLTRLIGGARASTLTEHEQEARTLMSELTAASLDAVAHDRPHPGLNDAFLARFPSLTARPELGSDQISYADDGAYLYGLAVASGIAAGAPHQGFVLRAWPLRFGGTGDLEYQSTEDGQVWEGSNCSGRSGTDFGFPPAFPDPDLNRPDAGWTPLTEAVAAHR